MTRPQPTPSSLTEDSFCRACSHQLSGPPHSECIKPEWHVQPTPSAEARALAKVLASMRMLPYDDGKGGWLFRRATATETAERLLASDWLAAYVQAARDEERARVLGEVAHSVQQALLTGDDAKRQTITEGRHVSRLKADGIVQRILRDARGATR